MSCHSALDLYFCNLFRFQVTTALVGLSSIGYWVVAWSCFFSDYEFSFWREGQGQCMKAVAESVVVMLAASLFVSTSVL